MSAVSEFFSGVGLLGRGLSMVIRRRRMFVLGAIPPSITSILFTLIVVALAMQLDPILDALTPFADNWSAGIARLVRLLVGVALVAGASLLMVISFTTLTLTLGSPLYDKISESVDRELGAVPAESNERVMTSLGRSLRQSLTLIGVSLLVAPLLFFAGFIPAIGQIVIPVVSATFGGWMLCIELIGSPFERRHLLRIRDRRAAMRRHRARVLGFAIPTFLLLAIPFVGVVVFPVATAAGTILARELLKDAPAGTVVTG